MVTVCAWCHRYLGPSEPEPAVTHGICEPCVARQHWADPPVIVVARHRAEISPVLEELLRGEPAVRVVVDRRLGDRRRSEGDPESRGERRRGPDRRSRRVDAVLI